MFPIPNRIALASGLKPNLHDVCTVSTVGRNCVARANAARIKHQAAEKEEIKIKQ